MKIERGITPWTYWKEHFPADERELIGLPNEILLSDIVGIEVPKDCNTVRSAYDALKAQGNVFLDGQILNNLWDKGCTRKTPLWNNPEFSSLSYAIFAGVLVRSRGPGGLYDAFPTLYCDNNEPKIAMFGWDEPLCGAGRSDGFGLSKTYFAVMRKND